MMDLLTTKLVITFSNHLSAKMSSSAVTPFPGVFNSSHTPAGLPWDTYSEYH